MQVHAAIHGMYKIDTSGIEPLLIVGNQLFIGVREAIALRRAIDELLSANFYSEAIDGAHACCGEVCLCDESHEDDETVLSGEIPASDSDAAVLESSL